LVMPMGCHSPAESHQKTFKSGDEAIDTFIAALRTDNKNELQAILGPDSKELLSSGDEVADTKGKEQFLQYYDEKHHLDRKDDKLILSIGSEDWPFPIPLIEQDKRWLFDTAAAKEEILNRRIGRNEFNTMQVMLAIVDAQREYAMQDRNDDGVLEYAQKINSDPHQMNGLYWKTGENEKPSPLGDLAASATQEGYFKKKFSDGPRPFHGYFYRIMTAQGPNAPGGAFDYIVDGKMIGGFAVAAYPAEYGNSGVMTFLVNHDGIIYEKDLGEATEQEGKNMKLFDPDQSWTKVQPQEETTK